MSRKAEFQHGFCHWVLLRTRLLVLRCNGRLSRQAINFQVASQTSTLYSGSCPGRSRRAAVPGINYLLLQKAAQGHPDPITAEASFSQCLSSRKRAAPSSGSPESPSTMEPTPQPCRAAPYPIPEVGGRCRAQGTRLQVQVCAAPWGNSWSSPGGFDSAATPSPGS